MNRDLDYNNFIEELHNSYPNEPFEIDTTDSNFTIIYHNNKLCDDSKFFELIDKISSKYLTEEESYNLTASLE